jgi:hypothetical protein
MALEIKVLDYGDVELESSFLVLGRDCGRVRREIGQDGKADVVLGKTPRVLPKAKRQSQFATCCIAPNREMIKPCWAQ